MPLSKRHEQVPMCKPAKSLCKSAKVTACRLIWGAIG